jgi:endonuclease/exonuclease/phosphatase family metal-dependent hydrolase
MKIPKAPSSLLAVLCLFIPTSLGAEPLKTVAWNIEWFPGLRAGADDAEKEKHFKAVVPELAKLDADILLAQEITDPRYMEKLAESAGLKLHVMSRFLDAESGEPTLQQQAISSKLEAHSAWFEEFKPSEDLPSLRRGFAFAALKHPDGGLIMTYSIHLKSNGGSQRPGGEEDIARTRKESIRQILAHKKEMEKSKFAGKKIVGWIIGGDMNSNHDGQFRLCTAVADTVASGFYNTWDGVEKKDRLTWRSNPDPEKRRFEPTTFDYIFTIGFKPAKAQIIDIPRELSDHSPLAVMLELE